VKTTKKSLVPIVELGFFLRVLVGCDDFVRAPGFGWFNLLA